MDDKNGSWSTDVNTPPVKYPDAHGTPGIEGMAGWLGTAPSISPALLSQIQIITSREQAEAPTDPGPAMCLTELDVQNLLDRLNQQGINVSMRLVPADPIVLGPLWTVTDASWCRYANAVFVYPNIVGHAGILVEEPRSSITVTMMNVQATAVVVELVNVGITPEGFTAVTTDDKGGSIMTRVAFSAPGIFLVRPDVDGSAVLRIGIGSGRTFVKQVIMRPVL